MARSANIVDFNDIKKRSNPSHPYRTDGALSLAAPSAKVRYRFIDDGDYDRASRTSLSFDENYGSADARTARPSYSESSRSRTSRAYSALARQTREARGAASDARPVHTRSAQTSTRSRFPWEAAEGVVDGADFGIDGADFGFGRLSAGAGSARVAGSRGRHAARAQVTSAAAAPRGWAGFARTSSDAASGRPAGRSRGAASAADDAADEAGAPVAETSAERRARRKRERRKQHADRMFDRQFAGDAAPRHGSSADADAADGAPRAALYKGRMGKTERKSARMQNASEAGSPSAKRSAGSWFSSFSMTRGRMVRLTVAVCAVLVCAFLYAPAQQYYQSSRDNARLQAEYDAIAQRNDALQQQNDILSTDAGIQDAVRSKYGYVQNGESTANVSGLSQDFEDDAQEVTATDANVVAGSVAAPTYWYTPILDFVFNVKE